ncbi:MAG TPA: hypothetical protein VFH08_05805, partial [Chitinophagaceae bacterium]|nr:hypothetical protein [Chitinophagaceae bacterium]
MIKTLSIFAVVFLSVSIIVGCNNTDNSKRTEERSQAYWERKNFEKAQGLAQVFEARTFVNSKGERLLYRLLKPSNYNPEKKYPFVVSLHH